MLIRVIADLKMWSERNNNNPISMYGYICNVPDNFPDDVAYDGLTLSYPNDFPGAYLKNSEFEIIYIDEMLSDLKSVAI